MEQEKAYNYKKHSIVNNVLYYWSYFLKNEPIVVILAAVEIIMGALTPLIGIYLPKITLDMVEQGVTPEKMLMIIGGFAICMAGVRCARLAAGEGKYWLYNPQRANMAGMLFLKSLKVKYEDTESADGRTAYRKAVDVITYGDDSAPNMIVNYSVVFVMNLLSFILYSTVLTTLNIFVVVILILLSLLNYFVQMSGIKFEESLRDKNATAGKHFWYVKGLWET